MRYPKRINIANLPTPIQTETFDGIDFLIKRDDFTGMEFSGNKIRKLEYLIYDALKNKSTKLYTCGGIQSNHARATAFAGVKYGLKSKLYLRGEEKDFADGNLLLNKVLGAEIVFVSPEQYQNINQIMLEDSKKDESEVYVIPEGGSNELGAFGYVNFIKELSIQLAYDEINGILSACGSGGTTAGMLVGSQIENLNLDIYAVNVCDDEEYFRNRIKNIIDKMLSSYELDIKIDYDRLKILDGYSKEGYTEIDSEKLELIKRFCQNSGILLDPVYTGKAFYAYWENFIRKNQSSRILFTHTGGLFGVFPRRKEFLR